MHLYSAQRLDHGCRQCLRIDGCDLVHPGSVWVEVQAATVEIDGSLEVLSVPVTAHASFDGHDLAVKPLGDRIGNAMRAVVHNMHESLMDRIGGADQWLQAGVHDLVVPAAEEGGCRPLAGDEPEVAEHFFERPSDASFQLLVQELVELLLLAFGEPLEASQSVIATSFEDVIVEGREFLVLGSPDVINGFAEQRHDVEPIVDDLLVRPVIVLAGTGHTGIAHVHGDSLDGLELLRGKLRKQAFPLSVPLPSAIASTVLLSRS